MYDCFNMAYQDNALKLHIKVNTENLLSPPQKYNAGSLRVPADPSWPKIPQRKLVDDISDTIEPPCIVKLTGTPRRSRTIIQTPLNQSPKSSATKDSAYSFLHHQKPTSSTHTLKRVPGYMDPRFKKVTNVKRNQLTSTESLGKENDVRTANRSELASSVKSLHTEELEKSIPERDTNTQQVKVQEAEKPDEARKTERVSARMDLSSPTLSSQDYNKNNNHSITQDPVLEQKCCVNDTESKKVEKVAEDICKSKILEKGKCENNCCEFMSKTTMNDANTQVDITPLPVQDKNGQVFFVLDKKLQSHPLNAIQLDTIAMPKECVHQCCNVQVPVLTYQNIPMPSTTSTNNMTQQYVSYSGCNAPNESVSLIKKESQQCTHCSNTGSSVKKCTGVTQHQIQSTVERDLEGMNICENENKSLLKVQTIAPDETKENKIKPDDIRSIKSTKASVNVNVPEKLESIKIQHKQQESSDSEYYIPNTVKRSVPSTAFQQLKVKKIICNTSGEDTTDSEFIARRNSQKKEYIDMNKLITKGNRASMNTIHGDILNSAQNNDQMNFISKERNEYFQSVLQSNATVNDQDQLYQKYKTALYDAKGKNKSEQNLSCVKNECIKKLCRNSEPYITFKHKKASAKFSRKARSYFQKNSHSALVDSDYTLVWPNCQYNKCKHSQTNVHKLSNQKIKNIGSYYNAKLPTNERNTNACIANDSSNVQQNYLKSDQDIDLCQEMLKNQSKTRLQKECCKCETSPRTNTDDATERKGISPKTQELLSKSYWEYYNRLRHKIKSTGNMEQQYLYHLAADTSETKKGKPDEACNKDFRNQLKLNPELQTLQQCSALSSMINKALDSNLQSDTVQAKQLYVNGNMKSTPDSVATVQSNNINKVAPGVTNNAPNKVRCKMDKENDRQFLELKSIIFFGGIMYILIIFLPMLYDYLYHEEYDDYENLSYFELIVDYVFSSFKEAFGDIFNGAKQIFFYPVRLRMKS